MASITSPWDRIREFALLGTRLERPEEDEVGEGSTLTTWVEGAVVHSIFSNVHSSKSMPRGVWV